MTKTKIEWTDEQCNCSLGCTKLSAGCQNCYAIREATIHAGHPNPKVKDAYAGLVENGNWTGCVKFLPERLAKLKVVHKKETKIFMNSMSDTFHEENSFINLTTMFAIMGMNPHNTYQVLTKRPERALEFYQYLKKYEDQNLPKSHSPSPAEYAIKALRECWLGTSVENQPTADERVHWLLQIPSAIHFVSCEPLLAGVDLTRVKRPYGESECQFNALSTEGEIDYGYYRLDWVIVGGESGPGARSMHPGHVRSLRDQCREADVAFLFKQWGEWAPIETHGDNVPVRIKDGHDMTCVHYARGINQRFPGWEYGICGGDYQHMVRVGKKAAGRELDGREWDEYPEGNLNHG